MSQLQNKQERQCTPR